MTTRNSRQLPNPVLSDSSPDQIRQRIELLHAQRKHAALRDEASTLTHTLEQTQQQLQKLSEYQQQLRGQLEALTAYAHYSVVITKVQRNGQLLAEVAGLGGTRMWVGVHPDVDPEQLLVGAAGVVSRERNCLLNVTAATGHWRDVGTFEQYLDAGDRILLRNRESLVAVSLAHELRQAQLNKGDLIGFDGETTHLAYARLEKPADTALFDENVTDDFSQLGGLDAQIVRIKRLIDFRFRHPHLASKYALKNKCGIMLYGMPGNGKTRIARCCAGYTRQVFPDRPCRFMHISGSSDYSMWFGQSEQNIIARFDAVRQAAGEGLVIMFWDEVDAIAKRRGSDFGSTAADRILNTYLSQIDGTLPLANVILLYATNRPDTLDSGLLRPGRTDEKIEIPTPNRRGAQAILQSYLGQGLPLAAQHGGEDELLTPLLSRLYATNGDYARVAEVKLSDGRRLQVAGRQLLSGALLENVVQHAAQQAAVREADTGQEGLTADDLALAAENEMAAAVSLLAPGNVKSYVKSIPQDAQPIAVEPLLTAPASTYVRRR